MFNEILAKHQRKWDGTAVELTAPTLRYIRIEDGKVLNLDYDPATDDPDDQWLDAVTAETIEQNLGAEITLARGFGITYPDLGGKAVQVQCSDGATFINHMYVLGEASLSQRGLTMTLKARSD